jgi:hypothetical protein
MKSLLSLLLVALVAANTVGCAASDRARLFRPMGTAAHDPAPGRDLFEQLPNWDTAAYRRCGAHLPANKRQPGMTDRC